MNFGISQYSENLSYPLFQQIREHQQAFSGVFAWAYTTLRIGEGAEARHMPVLGVTGEFLNTLGVLPSAGRLFRSEDDSRGCPAPAVVLGYSSGDANSVEVSPLSARIWLFRIMRSKSLVLHRPGSRVPKSGEISI